MQENYSTRQGCTGEFAAYTAITVCHWQRRQQNCLLGDWKLVTRESEPKFDCFLVLQPSSPWLSGIYLHDCHAVYQIHKCSRFLYRWTVGPLRSLRKHNPTTLSMITGIPPYSAWMTGIQLSSAWMTGIQPSSDDCKVINHIMPLTFGYSVHDYLYWSI